MEKGKWKITINVRLPFSMSPHYATDGTWSVNACECVRQPWLQI